MQLRSSRRSFYRTRSGSLHEADESPAASTIGTQHQAGRKHVRRGRSEGWRLPLEVLGSLRREASKPAGLTPRPRRHSKRGRRVQLNAVGGGFANRRTQRPAAAWTPQPRPEVQRGRRHRIQVRKALYLVTIHCRNRGRPASQAARSTGAPDGGRVVDFDLSNPARHADGHCHVVKSAADLARRSCRRARTSRAASPVSTAGRARSRSWCCRRGGSPS